MEGDVERKDLRPDSRCLDSRESVILSADTPKTLPEKRKQRGRDLIQGLQYPLRVGCPMINIYDAVMGITRVGTREAEGFDEDLDSTEYHDANDTTEETTRKEETEADVSMQKSTGFQGGYGSSSLKECIELLNTTTNIAPAPPDSGVGKSTDPQQVMSPSMEKSVTDAITQPSNGSTSQETVSVAPPTDGSVSQKVQPTKDEPLSQVKCEPVKEIKTESSSSAHEVKVEQEESETKGESTASVKQEEQAPEPDSEDSFTPERAVEVIQRLLEAQESRTGEREQSQRKSVWLRDLKRTRVRSIRTARGKKSEKKIRLAGPIHVQYYYLHRA